MQNFSGESLNDWEVDDHPWIENLQTIPIAYGGFFALQREPEGLKPMWHLRCIVAGRLGEPGPAPGSDASVCGRPAPGLRR